MSEKRLLQAAVLLVRSLKMISRPELMEIGAVSDLRSYLFGQETVNALFRSLTVCSTLLGLKRNPHRRAPCTSLFKDLLV